MQDSKSLQLCELTYKSYKFLNISYHNKKIYIYNFSRWKKFYDGNVELYFCTKFQPKSHSRPKSVYVWTVLDVQKWFKRFCNDYMQYVNLFAQHDITGRTLLRVTDNTLLRMGIKNTMHRDAIWREILKLKLKTDIIEIRDLQFRDTSNLYYDYSLA